MHSPTKSTSRHNIIELSEIEYSWGEGRATPQSSSFQLTCKQLDIEKGKHTFIYGPSGSGKSTLLGLICGTFSMRTGKIEVVGKDLTMLTGAQTDEHRARKLGIIFQQFNLVPYLNMIDNVILPLKLSRAKRNNAGSSSRERISRAHYLLEEMGIDASNQASKLPSQLSVGQQQRVAAARALIGKPELIIADEPTSALDENSQDKFVNLLLAQAKQNDATIVMVSHAHRLANLFDNSFEIQNGQITAGEPK